MGVYIQDMTIQDFENCGDEYRGYLVGTGQAFEVPIVYCKDCARWRLSEYTTAGIHICGRFSGVRGEHDFCSRGVARGEPEEG